MLLFVQWMCHVFKKQSRRRATEKGMEDWDIVRLRKRRKSTHLDLRVAPPQRCSWGRSPITSLGLDLESSRRCACSEPGERKRRGSAAVALHKGVTKKNTTDNKFNSLCCCTIPLTNKARVKLFFIQVRNKNVRNNKRKIGGQVRFWYSWVEPIPRLVLCCFPAGPLLPQKPQINQPIYSLLSHCNGDSEREEEMPVDENHYNIPIIT